MKQKILTIILCSAMLFSLLAGCGNTQSTSVESEAPSVPKTAELPAETPAPPEEPEPEIIVIETDFGSYTRLGENTDHPEELEDVEINVNDTIIQLSLPKDMGASFHFDADMNSLFIFNEDKSKIGFIYFSDFLQTETHKVAYDAETFANVIAFDGLVTTASEVSTLKDEDTLIVQHIPAELKDYTANELIQKSYPGEVLRYQTYNTDTIELAKDDGTTSKAYTGNKCLFYYGEDISSGFSSYIMESFEITEDGISDTLNFDEETDINDLLKTNTNLTNEEIVLQTSYLHSIAPMAEDAQWQSYINLGLYRTQITDDMTIEEIQEEIKKSHVHIAYYIGDYVTESFGSGFVIDIDEDFLYIMTNEHVADGGGKRSYGKKYAFYVRFANDFETTNNLIETYNLQGKYVGGKYTPDIAVIKCDISNIPYEDRYVFKAIPKIVDIELSQGMPVYMYHMRQDLNETLKSGALHSVDKIPYMDGTMSYFMNAFGQSGDSGSLVFTKNGQCLGIIVGGRYTPEGNYGVALPYDLIPTRFEEIVGRPLYDEISLKDFFINYTANFWNEISPTTIPSDTTLSEETIENIEGTQ